VVASDIGVCFHAVEEGAITKAVEPPNSSRRLQNQRDFIVIKNCNDKEVAFLTRMKILVLLLICHRKLSFTPQHVSTPKALDIPTK
jgi:hypothetical protein